MLENNAKFSYVEKLKVKEESLDKLNQDIECASCEKLLARSVQLKQIPQEMEYKLICPFCGGSSFKLKFKYKPFFEFVDCQVTNITGDEKCQVVDLKKIEVAS